MAIALAVREKPLLAEPKHFKARLDINYVVATRMAD